MGGPERRSLPCPGATAAAHADTPGRDHGRD